MLASSHKIHHGSDKNIISVTYEKTYGKMQISTNVLYLSKFEAFSI